MNLGELRRYVRTVLEVEAEDWPDDLIDASVQEAYARITGREQRWPFYEERWSLAVTAGIATYPLTAIGDVREITTLRIGNARLTYTSEQDAEDRYGFDSTGNPVEFSRWGDSMTLWPTPAVDHVVEVRGYREPLAFTNAAGWTPDLPDEFHMLLCDWALANEYQRQDDPEMMGTYRGKFEDQLAAHRKAIMATPTPGPLVMGGGFGRRRVV